MNDCIQFVKSSKKNTDFILGQFNFHSISPNISAAWQDPCTVLVNGVDFESLFVSWLPGQTGSYIPKYILSKVSKTLYASIIPSSN